MTIAELEDRLDRLGSHLDGERDARRCSASDGSMVARRAVRRPSRRPVAVAGLAIVAAAMSLTVVVIAGNVDERGVAVRPESTGLVRRPGGRLEAWTGVTTSGAVGALRFLTWSPRAGK